MGPQFRVSSKRLEKPGIERMTPVLEGKQLNHYATEASLISNLSEILKFNHCDKKGNPHDSLVFVLFMVTHFQFL